MRAREHVADDREQAAQALSADHDTKHEAGDETEKQRSVLAGESWMHVGHLLAGAEGPRAAPMI